ncbi:MAG TPA: alpha/beta fold hydrolase [Tepidisphaeraceae bacterium]|jgi:hypothetical protein|nr:alpha/beta fold hydrolase [Tepidisphaeraceae bacterium]
MTDAPAPARSRRPWRRGRKIALALLTVYALTMLFGCPADRLLLYPRPSAESVFDASPRMVDFNGGTLEVFVARSPGTTRSEPVAFMLEFTGNATRAEDIAGWVASRWGERPVETWVMNYPGYGRSTGDARLAALGPAALATYDELAKLAAGRPIVLAGNSMGSAVALHVATQRPVAGLILQNPPPLRQIVLRDHGWWNLWLLAGPVALSIPASLDSVAQARQVTVPAIFIMSDSDELVRPALQRKILEAYAGPRRVITLVGKGHNDSLDRPMELREFGEALDWLLSRSIAPEQQE